VTGAFVTSIYAYRSLNEKRGINVNIRIERNQSTREVLKRLKELNAIENEQILYFWIRYKHIPIKAGCYRLKGTYSPVEIVRELMKGSPCLTKITIPEGTDIFDVDKILSEKGFCRKGEVLKLSKDKEFLNFLRLKFLEGYIFPDTYYVRENESCKEIVEETVKNFDRKTKSLFKDYDPPEIVKRGLKEVTRDKILIVASIVEKETSLLEEKPIIAGIIYNRLIKGMKLQCDPTVFYAYKVAGIEKEKLHRGDTLFPSPYNTYYIKGLPPTPICNPGLDSIRAAIYPEKTQYLYFVAKKRGHIFSKSYNQHLKLIGKILKHGKKEKEEKIRNR
jgi:UPF0755 protein